MADVPQALGLDQQKAGAGDRQPVRQPEHPGHRGAGLIAGEAAV